MGVAAACCPGCDRPLAPEDLDGLCPACLLGSAISQPPEQIGEYRIVAEIGRGGMGVVYRAQHRISEHQVAIKMIRRDILNEEALRLFRSEIKAMLAVEHPRIVPILFVGEHEGELYYATKLFHSSLAARIQEFRPHPWASARLIETLARTVQFAHERGVLHLDLKPSNVLLDAAGRPAIGDFGLARLVNGAGASDSCPGKPPGPDGQDANPFDSMRSLDLLGTPEYFAPEQASPQGGRPTTVSDVYSLGVILYELFTGRPPFTGRVSELLPRITGEAPEPPSKRAPELPRDLEAICLKCLRKDPTARYPSAAELAEDLARARRGAVTLARPLSTWGRTARLLRRNPLRSFCAAALALVLLGVGIDVVRMAVSHDRETRDRVLDGNQFAATMAARALLDELRRRADWVAETAADPVAYELARDEPRSAVLELERLREGRFDLIAIFNRSGEMTAMSGPYEVVGRDYAWRDYFRGACEPGDRTVPGAYVARSFRSETDEQYKFAISAPIVRDGRCVGVVLATTRPDSALAPFVLINRGDPRHKAVVMGYSDRDRDAASPPPDAHLVLLHDGLGPSDESVPISPKTARDIRRRFGALRVRGQQLFGPDVAPLAIDDYRDPVSETSHTWLAAAYPVGGTGLVVAVQTRDDLAFELSELIHDGLLRMVGVQTAGCALIAGVLFLSRRRRSGGDSR